MIARARAALAGARWANAQYRDVHRGLKDEGLHAAVAPPSTVAPGSLRGARIALRARRATCLERSLILQRWWASRGKALDVIVGVRNPAASGRGPMGHAWVEHYDRDCSDVFREIRRVPPPPIDAAGGRRTSR